jgi:O-antigen ligase
MSEKNSYDEGAMPWHAWGCMAIAFLIPIGKKFVPGFIALLGIYCIVHAIRTKKVYFRQTNLSLVFSFLMFVLLALGFTYSDNPIKGLKEVEIKLSYLAFPLIAWLMPPLSKKNFASIERSFMYGCLLFIHIAIGYGIYRAMTLNDAAYLSYEQLGINYHPTYAATYQAMSLFILMRILWKNQFLFNKRWVHALAMISTILFISMLASKAGLIACVIAVALGTYMLIKKRISRLESTLVGIACVLLLMISAHYMPGVSARISAAVEDVEQNFDQQPEEDLEVKSSTQLRFVTWKTSWQVLLENPAGTGSGDTQCAIDEIYNINGERYALSKHLNAHNQFLQVGAEHGWPGLIVFVTLLATLFIQYIKNRNALLLCFLSLCVMNFFFESFLEVQAGIVFFCFWILVFARSDESLKMQPKIN